jgi:alpha-maltose-1-phosphate synthase
MKISIITQGKFHSENLAKILNKKKLLNKYILFYFSKLINKKLRSKTYCTNLLFLFYKTYIKFFKKDPPEFVNWFLKKNYENYVLNKITNEKILHIWPDCSDKIADHCKKNSIISVCEASSAHPRYKKKIVDNEFIKFKLKPETYSDKIYKDQLNFFKKSDYFFAPSNFVVNSLLKNGVAKKKIFFTPFGVDTDFYSKDRYKKKDKIIRIVCVGDFNLRKGCYYILKAFNQIKDKNLELHFIGAVDSDLRQICKKELSDKRIKLLGTMDKLSLKNQLKNYDIFCLASLEEGMSISMLEAMSMSLVPVCSENTGAKDIVRNGYDGFIFKIRDINGIKNKILKLKNNPKILKQMSKRIRKKICKDFSSEKYQQRVFSNYKKILKLI